MAEAQTAVSSPLLPNIMQGSSETTVTSFPEETVTAAELEKQQANAPSMWDAAKLGTTEWLHNYIPQLTMSGGGNPLVITPELEAQSGVSTMPAEYRDWIYSRATTDEEWNFYVNQAKTRLENMTKMANAGVPEIIAYGLVSAIDPVEIGAVGLTSYGIGSVLRSVYAPMEAALTAKKMLNLKQSVQQISAVSRAAKATKVERFVKGGAETAAVSLPFEMARSDYLPDYDLGDVGAVLASMTILGGTFHTMSRANKNMALAAMYFKRQAKHPDMPLSAAEREFYAPVIGLKNLDNAEATLKDLFNIPAGQTIGKASSQTATPNVKMAVSEPLGLGMKDVAVKNGSDEYKRLAQTVRGKDALPEDVVADEAYFASLFEAGKETTYKAIQTKYNKDKNILAKLEKVTTDEQFVELGKKGVRSKKKLLDTEYLLQRGKEMHRQDMENVKLRMRVQDTILQDRLEKIKNSGADTSTPTNAIDSSDMARYENAPRQLGFNVLAGGKTLRARLSSIAEAMQSDIGLIRHLGEALSQNFAGRTDRRAVNQSAEEIANMVQHRKDAQFLFVHRKNQEEWIKQNGKSAGKSKLTNIRSYMEDQMQFNKLVSEHIRFKNQSSPEVIASAQKAESIMANIYGEAIDAKASGFSKQSMTDNYLPRIYNDVAMDDFIARMGKGEAGIAVFKQRFVDAIAQGNPEMLPEVAKRIGEGYADALLARMRNPSTGAIEIRRSQVAEDSIDSVLDIIKKESTVSPEELANIENEVTRLYGAASEGQEGIARARRRMTLDEQPIKEFLEDDIEELLHSYSFQMGGAIGLARNGIDVDGGKSFTQIVADIRMHNQTHRITDQATLDRQIEALEFMYDSVTGGLKNRDNFFGAAEPVMRRIRDYNFMRTMGSTGLTSMIEIGSLLDHHFVNIFRMVPELRKLFRKTIDGDIEDDLVREMQHFAGTGIDSITGRAKNHWDDYENTMLRADYNRWDTLLGKGRTLTANLSGMLPLTMALRRMDTYLFAQDFFATAMSKKVGAKVYSKIKLEQLGISPEDHEAIMGLIRKHSDKDKNGKLITLNLKDWATTPEGKRLQQVFSLATRRHTLSSIQETSAGSVNRMLRSSVGRTMFQFMSYPLAAQEQQAQRLFTRIAHGDKMVASRVIMAQALMAGMVYYTQTYQRSLGMSKEKRRKYLEDRLTPSRIIGDGVLGMIGVSGAASALYGQINQNNLLRAPTVDLLYGASNIVNIGSDAIFNGKDISEGQYRQMSRILFLQNWYLSNWTLNALSAEAAGK